MKTFTHNIQNFTIGFVPSQYFLVSGKHIEIFSKYYCETNSIGNLTNTTVPCLNVLLKNCPCKDIVAMCACFLMVRTSLWARILVSMGYCLEVLAPPFCKVNRLLFPPSKTKYSLLSHWLQVQYLCVGEPGFSSASPALLMPVLPCWCQSAAARGNLPSQNWALGNVWSGLILVLWISQPQDSWELISAHNLT